MKAVLYSLWILHFTGAVFLVFGATMACLGMGDGVTGKEAYESLGIYVVVLIVIASLITGVIDAASLRMKKAAVVFYAPVGLSIIYLGCENLMKGEGVGLFVLYLIMICVEVLFLWLLSQRFRTEPAVSPPGHDESQAL